jgi:hypothetical protein
MQLIGIPRKQGFMNSRFENVIEPHKSTCEDGSPRAGSKLDVDSEMGQLAAALKEQGSLRTSILKLGCNLFFKVRVIISRNRDNSGIKIIPCDP